MHEISDYISNFISLNAENSNFSHTILAVFVAYLGGILASLTPCVYPMIPITVGIVGGMGPASERNWHDVLFRGFSYVGGMTLIYSLLGVLAGVSGKVFGSFTNTSGWYNFLGLTMTFASLVMLEVIPFNPAQWWEQAKRKLSQRKSKSVPVSQELKQEMSLMGAFFLGASSGLIAAPCTTPVLTSILAYIAKTQSVGLGFLLMASFSLGLGTLLLAITAFAGALVLPKSGRWMKSLKSFSGLILLAFAEYLIYRAGNFGGP